MTILFEIFMRQVTAFTSPGFLSDPIKFNLTVDISRILFFYFSLIVGSSMLSGVLNSIRKFSYYAIVPVFLNISLILFIIFGKSSFKTFAHTLAYGVLVGGICQFGYAYFGCVKNNFHLRILFPSHKIFSSLVLSTFRKMFPAMVAGGLSQINTLLDLILGSLITSGVSYLYFIDRIFYLPTASIGTAIGIVVLPMLSAAVTAKRKEEVSSIQTEAINLSSLLVLPVAFVLIFCADVFVSVIFQRGNFTYENTKVIGACLKILGAALPFVVYMKVLSSIFFSEEDTKTPMYIALACALSNMFFSLILMPYLGIYGIITGSALSYLIDAIISFYILSKKNFITINIKKLVIFNIKVLIAACIFGIFCYLLFVVYEKTNYYAHILNQNLFIKFIYIFGIGGVGLLIYYFLLICMKVEVRKAFKL